MLRRPFLLATMAAALAAACSSPSSSSSDTPPPPAPAPPPPNAPPPPPGDDAGSDGGGPMGPTIDANTAATDYAAAYCGYLRKCYAVFIDELVGSDAQCKTLVAQAFVTNGIPGALYDQAAFGAAVSCLDTATCDELYGGKWQVACVTPPAVNRYATGAACNRNEECASDYCSNLTPTACGTCAPSTVSALGASCDESMGKRCAIGQICAGTCIQVRFLGESCDQGSASAKQYCGSALVCTGNVCVKAGALNAMCTGSSQCDVFAGVECDKTQMKCATMTFGAAADPCDEFGPRECGPNLYCNVPSGGMTTVGTCAMRVAVNGACTSSSQCTFGANCRNDVCVPAGSDAPVCK